MAIVKFGVTVAGLRGTVGGGTFSANKSGPYMKTWSRGPNQRSTLQTSQRNRIATWAAAWRSLSGAQQAAWDAYAALPAQELTNSLGEPYYVSGFAWYVSCNAQLQEAGDPAISNAPVLAVPAAPLLTSFVFKATGAASATRMGFNAADPTLTMKKAVYMGVSSSLGRTVPPTKTRLTTLEAPVGTAINFQAEVQAVWGTILPDMRGWVYVYNQNSEGRRGPAASLIDDSDTP